MALIVKCKCGKQMKIPTALGGKKLSCPGCKKSFSIPPERFKAGIPKSPVAPKGLAAPIHANTAAPPPRPAPPPPASTGITLDPTPSELDLLAGYTDIPSGVIGDNSDLLAPVCPSCSVSLAADAKICVKCGYDLRTGKHITGESVTGLPVQEVAYAQSSPSNPLKSDRAAIQGPSQSYWIDAARAFVYPFESGGNLLTFAFILTVAMLRVGLNGLAILGLLFLFAWFFGNFLVFGYFAALYLSIVRDTASGFSQLPGIKIEDGVYDDIVKPAFKYAGAFACAIGPAVLYLFAAYLGMIPESLQTAWAFLLWLGLGIFLLPFFIMFFAFDALAMLWRVDLMISTIFRTFVPYICLWLLLLIVNFDIVLTTADKIFKRLNLDIPLPALPDFGNAGIFIYPAISVYLTIVAMRQIGLFYLHFKKRFTLVFE